MRKYCQLAGAEAYCVATRTACFLRYGVVKKLDFTQQRRASVVPRSIMSIRFRVE